MKRRGQRGCGGLMACGASGFIYNCRTGMGTKVQCKSYMPGYCPMRDLDEGSNSSWSSYFDNKTSSGHLYSGFMLQPVNEHSEHDREIVKRTMLEHEAIFRKQVYELHRLYRIQKDLMDELRMKQFIRYSSQSNSFSSQMLLEGTQTKWQMPQVPVVNHSSNGGSVVGSTDIRPPINFLKESSMRSIENGDSLKDCKVFNSETKVFPKRMLDLQLPADVYIDSEDAERTEREDVADSSFGAADPLNINRELEPEKNVKLTLGPCEDPSCINVSWRLDAKSQNDLPARSLVDLNEPLIDTCYEGSAGPGPASTQFLGGTTELEEAQGHHFLQSATRPISLYMDFSQDMHGDKGACSKFVSVDEREIRQHRQRFDNVAGPSSGASSFNLGFCNETFPMSCEAMQTKLKKTHDILLPDQEIKETLFREKPTNVIDDSRRGSHFANSQVSGPFSLVPHIDLNTSSPAFSSSRVPLNGISHIPIAVQARPCFNKSSLNLQNRTSDTAVQNPSSSYNEWQYNADTRLKLKFDGKSSAYQNGFHHPSYALGKPNLTIGVYESAYGNSDVHVPQKCSKGLQCSDVKSAKDVNLNQILPNGIFDAYTAQQDTEVHDLDRNHKELFGVLSWLRSPCDEQVNLERHASQMLLALSHSCSQPFSSCVPGVSDIQKRHEKEKGPSLCIRKDDLSVLQAKEINLNAILDPVADKVVGKKPKAFKNQINLNLDVADSSETSHEDDSNFLASPSIPSVVAKASFKIDLEAPLTSQAEENTPPQGQVMCKTDDLQETECSWETVIKVAAENIIALSQDMHFQSDNSTCHLSASVSHHADVLHWFAEVASSNGGRARRLIGSSDDEESDSFEALTLKLEETKMDEYWCKPKELETPKDDEKSNVSLLIRRRRGQGRRRRQQRDFQKDILPGLTSLSRHEVTEDFQAFGGLMKASGRQAKLARRSTGRKPRSQAVNVAEVCASPPATPPQSTPVELDKADGTSILGWGRTTRRCRRQRCPPGNITTPLP